jgi:heme-degrading monooxygenase HmoA
MIARLWSARTRQDKSQAYLRHFSIAILPALRTIKGYVTSSVLTRATENTVEIMVMTFWPR